MIHVANLIARLLLLSGIVYTVVRSTDLMHQILDTFPVTW